MMITPNETDILLGRGGNNNRNNGNEHLRSLCRMQASKYDRSSKREKANLINSILEEAKSLCRFLIKDKNNLEWNIADRRTSREKVSQTLRDAVYELTGKRFESNSSSDDEYYRGVEEKKSSMDHVHQIANEKNERSYRELMPSINLPQWYHPARYEHSHSHHSNVDHYNKKSYYCMQKMDSVLPSLCDPRYQDYTKKPTHGREHQNSLKSTHKQQESYSYNISSSDSFDTSQNKKSLHHLYHTPRGTKQEEAPQVQRRETPVPFSSMSSSHPMNTTTTKYHDNNKRYSPEAVESFSSSSHPRRHHYYHQQQQHYQHAEKRTKFNPTYEPYPYDLFENQCPSHQVESIHCYQNDKHGPPAPVVVISDCEQVTTTTSSFDNQCEDHHSGQTSSTEDMNSDDDDDDDSFVAFLDDLFD